MNPVLGRITLPSAINSVNIFKDTATNVTVKNSDTAADQIAATNSDFYSDPSPGKMFDAWFNRWKDTFQHEFSRKDGA